MTNCSFNQFKDLVGIHQVIFDSLLSGSDLNTAVKNLSGYLDNYSEDFKTFDSQRLAEFTGELEEAVKIGLDIFQDFNKETNVHSTFNNDYATFGVGNNIIGSTIAKFLPAGVSPTQEENSSIVENSFLDTLEPSSNVSESLNDEVKSTVITTADNVTIQFRNPNPFNKDVDQIKSRFYSGVPSAFNSMQEELWETVFNHVVLPLSLGSIKGVTSLNDSIKEIKSTLLKKLLGDSAEDLNYYSDTNYNAQFIKNTLDALEHEYSNKNNKGLTVADVRTMALNPAYNKDLQKYNAFVTLKYFDDLIGNLSSGKIALNTSMYNVETNMNKYLPLLNESNVRKSFREDDIDMSGLTQLSDFYEGFIGNMRVLDLHGRETSQRLDPMTVAYTLSRFRESINLNDTVGSLKKNIQDGLRKYLSGTSGTTIALSDAKVLLTLYNNIFKTANTAEAIQKDLGVTNSKALIDRLVMVTGRDSLMQNFKDFKSNNENANLFEMVVSDMNKLDPVSYSEVTIDFATGVLHRKTFLSRESDTQFYILKSLGNFASQQTKATLDRDMNKNGTKANSYSADQKGTVFTFRTSTGKVINYDTFSNTYVDNDGSVLSKSFPTNIIKTPPLGMSLQVESVRDLKRNYPDYMEMISMFDNLLKQPLASQNFSLLDMFREMSDYRDGDGNEVPTHLDVIMKMAGNFSFLSHLNAAPESVNGRINDKLANVKNMIHKGQTAMGLTENNKFRIEDIWDAKNNTYKLELSENAAGGYGAMKEYSRILNNYYNTSIKSVTMNSDGNALPTYILATMMNRVHQIKRDVHSNSVLKTKYFDKSGKEVTVNKKPVFRNNIFIKNGNLINSIDINAGIKNKDGEVSSSGKMSLIELTTASINGNFLDSMLNDGITAYQTTNFSDKGKHSTVTVDRKGNFTYLDSKGNTVTKAWNKMTTDDFRDSYLSSMDSYYSELFDNTMMDYTQLFESNTNAVLKSVYESSDYLSLASLSADGNPVITDVLMANANFKSEYDRYVAVSRALQASKDFAKLDKVRAAKSVNDVISLLSMNELSEAFNIAGVDYIDTLHANVSQLSDSPYKGKVTLNDNLLDSAVKFKDLSRIKTIRDKFVKSLVNMNYHMDLRGLDGSEDAGFKRYLYQLGQTDKKAYKNIIDNFMDKDHGRMRIQDDNGNLHPLLEKYLWENLLVARNFQLLTVGSPLEHPAKIKKSEQDVTPEKLESARLTAQNKRMVILQASHHPVMLNTLSGLGGITRSIIVKDPSRSVSTAYGKEGFVDVTDGATFSNPIHTMLFGESLMGEHSGHGVKSIRGEIDPITGVAALLKHAEYGITNLNVLNGYGGSKPNQFLQLMKRTMSDNFTDLYGHNVDIDITKNHNDQNHNIIEDANLHFVYSNRLGEHFESLESRPTEGSLIQVNKITKNSDGGYTISYTNKNIDQKFEVTKPIVNLYELWRSLGGEQSVEKVDSEVGRYEKHIDTVLDGFIPSMNSTKAVKDFVNQVGVRIDNLESKVGAEPAKAIAKNYRVDKLRGAVPTDPSYMNQLTVIQPLKNSLIGQVSFKGAVKVGASNAISMKKFMGNEPLPVNSHSAAFYGMQLNAEHAVGADSKVIEQSQIITALSFVGTSPEHASKAFNAIYDYVAGKMLTLMPAITNMRTDPNQKNELKRVMRKIVTNSLGTKDITGMASAVVEALKAEMDVNGAPLFNIPVSSPDLYNTVFTTLSNFLTAEGIRRNLPGLASVLKPGNGFLDVRSVYVYDENTGKYVSETMMEDDYISYVKDNLDRQTVIPYAENLNFNVELLTTVIEDVNGKKVTHYLDNVGKYLHIKSKMKKNPSAFSIDLEGKREMKATSFDWEVTSEDGVKTNMNHYDLPISMLGNIGKTRSMLISKIGENTKKLSINTLKLEYETSINSDPALLLALQTSNELLSVDIDRLNADLVELAREYQKVLDLSGINEEILKLNKVRNIKRNDQNEVEVDGEGNVTVEEVDTQTIPLFDGTTFEKGHSAIAERLIKNLLNKQLALVNEGYSKPSVFDIPSLVAKADTIKVFTSTGKSAGTLSDHINKQRLIFQNKGITDPTIEQLIGAGDIYLESDSVNTSPGEIMASNIYKDRLGLSAKHTPANVTEETMFRRLEAKNKPTTSLQDLFAVNGKGEHTYIVFEGSNNHKELIKKHNLRSNTNIKIDKDPLTGYNHIYDNYGNKKEKVPYSELFIADVNNTVKNYVVIPKGREMDLAVMLKDNGGTFTNIIPNFSKEANLNKLTKLINANILKTSKRTREAIEQLNSEMSRYKKAFEKADEKGKLNTVLEVINYYDEKWAIEELGEVQEDAAYSKKPKDKAKLNGLASIIRGYIADYKVFSAMEDGAEKIVARTKLLQTIKEITAIDRGDKIVRITTLKDKALASTANILIDIQNKHYKFVSKNNRILAKKQHAAFKTGLNIAAARIPGQHFQSFMGQRIVGFTNDEHNIAYVSTTHMLITGEDFDIDKAYLTYFGLNRDGVMPGWSKYWRDDSPEELSTSLQLPLPTNIELGETITTDSLMSLNMKDVTSLANLYANLETDTGNDQPIGTTKADLSDFKRAARALSKVSVLQNKLNKFDNTATDIHISPDVSKSPEGMLALENALKFIEYYNNSTQLDANTDRDYEAAYANAITAGIVNTGNDIRNTNIQLSPVDFGEFGDLADTSQKGIEMKSMSYENPLDIYAAQVYAMVGKDVIAIAASSGLKPFGTIAYNFTHVKNRGVGPEMNMLNKGKNDLLDYAYNIISTVSMNDPLEIENVATWLIGNTYGDLGDYTIEQQNKINGVKENLKDLLYRNNMLRIDAALELSGILSAATDNAKELILGRINAGPATAGYYLTGSILHKSANEIGDLMMSPTAEAALKMADRNLFKGRKITFENALAEMMTGNLNLQPYMNIDVADSLAKHLRKLPIELKGRKGKVYTSMDEYIMGTLSNAPKDAVEKYMKDLARSPYAYVMNILNTHNAKRAGINFKDIVDLILAESKTLKINKAAGVSKDTSVKKPMGSRMSQEDIMNQELFQNEMYQEREMDFDSENEIFGNDFIEDEMLFDSGVMSEFFNNDDFGDLYKSKQVPANVLINRYLQDVDSYMSDVDLDVIMKLAELEPLKKDLETLGKFASVNQGVKNTFFDLYQYGDRVKKYLTENFPVYMQANSDRMVTDIMDDYHNNAEFKSYLDGLFRVPLKEDTKFTSNINLLSLLFNTGHMSAMQNISFKAAQWNDNVSIKTRMMQDMADKSGVKLSRKNFGVIQNYANDALIVDVLGRIGGDTEADVLFDAFKGQIVDPTEGVLKQNHYTMDIRTVEGRSKFLSWFETTVIPTLQEGKTALTDGTLVDTNTENNSFLKSLTIDSKMDRRVGERYHYYTVRMDTNKRTSTKNLILHDVLIDEFASMRNLKFNGKKLTDLFFLYNLFIFKGRNTKGSFGSFLNVVSDGYQNDSLMSKFMNRLGWLDNETQNRGEDLYSLEELYNKGYATDTTYIPEVYKGAALKKLTKNADDKYIMDVYKWVWKPGTKELVLNSPEGSYVKLAQPKYNERTINVTAERNYTDGYKTRMQEEIILKKLQDLVKNNFEMKIETDC